MVVLVLVGCGSASDDGGSDTGSTSSGGEQSGGPSSSDGDPDTGSSSEASASSEGGSSESASSGEAESDTDTNSDGGLFDCRIPVACSLFNHIGPEGDVQCAAQAVLSTEPVAMLAVEDAGPDIDGTYMFIVSWGDGTALLQTREYDCRNCSDDDPSSYTWSDASAQQLCTVVLADGLEEACGCGLEECDDCQWDPWPGDCVEGCTPGELADCVPIDTPYDCAALEAALAGG